jgi:hypothetical protein
VTRRLARHVIPVAAASVLLAACGGSLVDTTGRPPRLLVVVEDRVSFEELLAVRQFEQLARSGGAGLMTTHVRALTRQEQRDGFPIQEATIAWGTTAVPEGGRVSPIAEALRNGGVPICSYGDPAAVGPLTMFIAGPRGITSCADLSTGDDRVVILDDGQTRRMDAETCDPTPDADRMRSTILGLEGEAMARASFDVGASVSSVAVLVVAPSVSCRMKRVGDEVTPVILGSVVSRPLDLTPEPPQALSSVTSRRTGLIPNVDIAPTILRRGPIVAPIPDTMDGQPIRFSDAPAPFHLHRIHLEQRRIRVPLQLGEVALVSLTGLLTIGSLVVVSRRRELRPVFARTMRFAILAGVALLIPLSLGGWLPRLTYPVVLPFIVVSVIGLVVLAQVLGPRTRAGPFAVLGAIGLVVMAADAAAGWRGLGIPLVGGTMFDGVRFYGLPNAFLFLLAASAMFVAWRLPSPWGFALLVAAALFAGSPWTGADMGGAATLFAAAAMWWAVRVRRRAGPLVVVEALLLVVAGVAAVLLLNRYGPGPTTHATHFVERTGGSASRAWAVFRDRLSQGAHQVRDAPAAILPLLGLPVVGWLVVRARGAIGDGLQAAGQRWRVAVMTLCVAGMVAFFANDTGVAAAAPAFLYALAALAYPTIVTKRGP